LDNVTISSLKLSDATIKKLTIVDSKLYNPNFSGTEVDIAYFDNVTFGGKVNFNKVVFSSDATTKRITTKNITFLEGDSTLMNEDSEFKF